MLRGARTRSGSTARFAGHYHQTTDQPPSVGRTRISLAHAILTALLERPSTGLELTRRFDSSIGHFWTASHQQIYRELGKLETAGLIRALPQQSGRGRPKSFEVLRQGKDELAAWTAKAADPRPPREALLVRLRAAAVLGTGDLDQELRRHLEMHRRTLASYEELERSSFAGRELDPADRIDYLLLQAGIVFEGAWVEWCRNAADELAEIRRSQRGS